MGTTLTELNLTLKRIEALLSPDAQPKQVIIGSSRRAASTIVDFTSTNTLLAAIRDKLLALPSTEAKQDVQETSLDLIADRLLFGGATAAQMLVDIDGNTDSIESKLDEVNSELDNIESSLNTLITANAANFGLNIAEMGVQAVLMIAAIAANAITVVASVAIGNARLSDIKTAVEGTEADIALMKTDIDNIKNEVTSSDDSLNEIESAIEAIEAVAGYWTGMSLGEAVTAGHLGQSIDADDGAWGVHNTHHLTYLASGAPTAAMSCKLTCTTPIKFHSQSWSLSANANARTIVCSQIPFDFLTATYVLSSGAGISGNSAINGTNDWGDMNERGRLRWIASGALAAAERLIVAGTVEVWVPVV